jgi:MazG family protein
VESQEKLESLEKLASLGALEGLGSSGEEGTDLAAARERELVERAAGVLFEVMRRLRGPGGCPWDREQTSKTLRPFLLEEAYEALEAIDDGDPRRICEELGDLLFQVVFHAEIHRERDAFSLAGVLTGVAAKLVRRHPHVFAGAELRDKGDLGVRWEAQKRAERVARGEEDSVLAGVPRTLPALSRAHKLQERAARVGFDWPSVDGALAKLDEETFELREAILIGEPAAVASELGDLLFSIVNVSRKLGIHAEDALRGAATRFGERFRYIERRLAETEREAATTPLEDLEALWDEAKERG